MQIDFHILWQPSGLHMLFVCVQTTLVFHNDDLSSHRLTVDNRTTVAQVCEQLVQCNHALNSPHWTIVERLSRYQLGEFHLMLWHWLWWQLKLPYDVCVGGDVKHYSIQSNDSSKCAHSYHCFISRQARPGMVDTESKKNWKDGSWQARWRAGKREEWVREWDKEIKTTFEMELLTIVISYRWLWLNICRVPFSVVVCFCHVCCLWQNEALSIMSWSVKSTVHGRRQTKAGFTSARTSPNTSFSAIQQ